MSFSKIVRCFAAGLLLGSAFLCSCGDEQPFRLTSESESTGTEQEKTETGETPPKAGTERFSAFSPFTVMTTAQATDRMADIRISQKDIAVPNADNDLYGSLSTTVDGALWHTAWNRARFEDATFVPAVYSPTMSVGDEKTLGGAAFFSAKDRQSEKTVFVFSCTSTLSGTGLEAYLQECRFAVFNALVSLYQGNGKPAFDLVICAELPAATPAEVRGTIGLLEYSIPIDGKKTDLVFALKEICADGGHFVYTTMNGASSTPVETIGTAGVFATMNFPWKYVAAPVGQKLSDGMLVADNPVYKNLVFADEFDGDALDFTKWSFDVPMKTRNNERETYVSDPVAPNVTVSEGALHLTALLGADGKVTSGAVNTCGMETFTRGRFEMRAKFPADGGSWPAFWMQGQEDGVSCFTSSWPKTGEIDILEEIDGDGHSHFTVHIPSGSSTLRNNYTDNSVNISDGGWHTLGLIWTEDQLGWYIDGKIVFVCRIDSASFECYRTYPQYLLLNLAIEGSWPAKKWTVSESDFAIDYVRVYQ